MQPALDIGFSPESLDEGTPEERACFGVFHLRAGEADLAGGMDYYISAYRPGPLVPAYYAAEWLAWNWWRLCAEPWTTRTGWWRAHRTTAIGEGYAWPNITIASDGVRTSLRSDPSVKPSAKPFRFLGAAPQAVATNEFQSAVDRFIGTVQARLREKRVAETSLDAIWRTVIDERRTPALAERRRLEALLGRDDDDADDEVIDRLLADAAVLGKSAVEELAANSPGDAPPPTMADLQSAAQSRGFPASAAHAARLAGDLPEATSGPAWQLGAETARRLRSQERLGTGPVPDTRLCELLGVAPEALQSDAHNPHPLSFALNGGLGGDRIVLRSKWRTGRRFELARLLAERIVAPSTEALYPATRANTYRQKVQRAFAAEFLSPFDALEAVLEGDYSDEAQLDAAEHFDVSGRMILTQLVNHRRLDRDEIEQESAALS